jgi:PAS domain-containing protein
MMLRLRLWRSATTSALLPVATAALATGIFIADVLAGANVVLAMLYMTVVLVATRFCRPLGVVLFAAGCMGLTVLSYFLSGETAVNAAISTAAIWLTTFLGLESKRATEAQLESEQQWKEVFEHNPVMYFMVNPTGTVLSVNRFWRRSTRLCDRRVDRPIGAERIYQGRPRVRRRSTDDLHRRIWPST